MTGEQVRNQGSTWAEQARSAVAGARTGTLRTRSCRTASTETVVSVEATDEGLVRVRLEGSSPAVPALAACRVATLTLAGPGSRVVQLTGSFTMGSPDASGVRCYTPTLLSVRLVTPGCDDVVVPVDAFLRSRPDAFAHQADAVLRHLTAVHGDDMLTGARAQGYDAAAVVPLSLDRTGVELAVLTLDGVDRWRVPFDGCPLGTPGGADLRTVRLPVDCTCPDRV